MHMLVLGGTTFIGPFQVEHALARGHRVTVLNRGQSDATLFADRAVEQLRGDLGGDLSALAGRRFDVVLDNPTWRPAWVRNVAQALRDGAAHYLFISTISVYPQDLAPGSDETATPLDPAEEGAPGAHYGSCKRQCELEVAHLYPDRHAIVRPGLIVGPRDPSDRFTYWPVRVAAGGDVLAPGTPDDPVQVVDVRDLAEWTVRLAEARARGTYNATGPAERLSIGRMLEVTRIATASDARFTWVPEPFLEAHGAQPWKDLPAWAGATSGFTQVAARRAVAAGLTFRPLSDTVRDTLAWHAGRPEAARAAQRAATRFGLTRERESELLAAWRARA